MTDPKLTPEEKFRSSLQDVAAITERLSSVCKTPEEMVSVINLAMENDAQLRILMKLVLEKK